MAVHDDAVSGLRAALERAAEGVHDTEGGAVALDSDLPAGLVAVYRAFDGADLFQGDLYLAPQRAWERAGSRIKIGALGEDDLFVDATTGVVWIAEDETGEETPEGSSLDRWLWGFVEAQSLLYDREGEFLPDVFDDDSELLPEIAIARERCFIKRDKRCGGPRWRLARALFQQGEIEAARDQLEQVVDAYPAFGWAWYDLAQLSAKLGDLVTAREEALHAADADPAYEHGAFFLAYAAKLAQQAGDEAARAEIAARALAKSPGLVRQQLDGAEASLAAGEMDAARELAEVAAALAPRDLSAADLLRRIPSGPDSAS